MIAPAVTVIDYGIGNLLNVVRALQRCGGDVTVVSQATQVSELPDRLVLPGVGAFIGGMQEMRQRGFDDLVKRFAATERPFLGICVGAQMLFEFGEEYGEHAGLGLIPGRVQQVPQTTPAGGVHRIPHIGWSELRRPAACLDWAESPLARMPERGTVYFVHSYAPVPTDDAHRLADTYYDGVRICAAVGKGNVWGCQFHPERSGENGLGVLQSFIAL